MKPVFETLDKCRHRLHETMPSLTQFVRLSSIEPAAKIRTLRDYVKCKVHEVTGKVSAAPLSSSLIVIDCVTRSENIIRSGKLVCIYESALFSAMRSTQYWPSCASDHSSSQVTLFCFQNCKYSIQNVPPSIICHNPSPSLSVCVCQSVCIFCMYECRYTVCM